jgi:hypothetical protein
LGEVRAEKAQRLADEPEFMVMANSAPSLAVRPASKASLNRPVVLAGDERPRGMAERVVFLDEIEDLRAKGRRLRRGLLKRNDEVSPWRAAPDACGPVAADQGLALIRR